MLGSLQLDAVLKVDHSSSLAITQHAVEKGSDITDHSRMENKEVIMEVGMTDSGTLYTRGGKGRSVAAFKALQQLQASGVPFSVTTRLCAYQNMLIANLSAPDDFTTMNALKATVTLQEVRIVKSSTVGIDGRSAQPQKTGSTNNGTQQAAPVDNTSPAQNQSILSSIAEKASGLLGGNQSIGSNLMF